MSSYDKGLTSKNAHYYRWDPAAANSLPNYMISCYKALYTITNDIADMVREEHGVNSINHLKKAVCYIEQFFIFYTFIFIRNQLYYSVPPHIFLIIVFDGWFEIAYHLHVINNCTICDLTIFPNIMPLLLLLFCFVVGNFV